MYTAMGLAGGRAMYIRPGRAGSWYTSQASSCDALHWTVALHVNIPLSGLKRIIVVAPVLLQSSSWEHVHCIKSVHEPLCPGICQSADQLDAVMHTKQSL